MKVRIFYRTNGKRVFRVFISSIIEGRFGLELDENKWGQGVGFPVIQWGGRFGWESERRECLGFWSRVIYLERPSWPEKCVMCWVCATF